MTTEAFVRPQNVAVCLLLLIGYSGEARDDWLGPWPPSALVDESGRPLAEERRRPPETPA